MSAESRQYQCLLVMPIESGQYCSVSQRDCWKTNADGPLLFQALPLLGEILRRVGPSPRLPACLHNRASGAKPVCSLLPCDRKSLHRRFRKRGHGLQDCSNSIDSFRFLAFHRLGYRFGPVLLRRNTIARQISRRKLLISISSPKFSYYATSFRSTIVGTCISSSHSER
jgi:hypothetical protein